APVQFDKPLRMALRYEISCTLQHKQLSAFHIHFEKMRNRLALQYFVIERRDANTASLRAAAQNQRPFSRSRVAVAQCQDARRRAECYIAHAMRTYLVQRKIALQFPPIYRIGLVSNHKRPPRSKKQRQISDESPDIEYDFGVEVEPAKI